MAGSLARGNMAASPRRDEGGPGERHQQKENSVFLKLFRSGSAEEGEQWIRGCIVDQSINDKRTKTRRRERRGNGTRRPTMEFLIVCCQRVGWFGSLYSTVQTVLSCFEVIA